jgi:hypothetical protein
MSDQTFLDLLDALLRQDPLTAVVVLLLVMGEIRTRQALAALKLLQSERQPSAGDSKATLTQKG